MKASLQCVQDAIKHSFKRKLEFPKKITAELCRKHIEVAQIVGEMSGAERILSTIVKAKADTNGNVNIEDLEAAIQLFIHDVGRYVETMYSGKSEFALEDILKEHGYLPKQQE